MPQRAQKHEGFLCIEIVTIVRISNSNGTRCIGHLNTTHSDEFKFRVSRNGKIYGDIADILPVR